MTNLETILALGKLAHVAILRCLDFRLPAYPLAHQSHYLIQISTDQLLSLLALQYADRPSDQCDVSLVFDGTAIRARRRKTGP